MKKIILGLFIVVGFYSYAQPSIQWQRSLGGSGIDYGFSLTQTSDGGAIILAGVAIVRLLYLSVVCLL